MTVQVYIVDDDAPVRSALSLLVGSFGWNVSSHASAASFLEIYRPDNKGCLLLDLDMPNMNGAELCEHLTALQSTLPIVIITAHQGHPLAERAIKAGARAVLPKPLDIEQLFELIAALLPERTPMTR